mmetsp:Transcript_106574/g.339963  ORF Transcript_106574/g.339963 Transcript_106574/m.339963 type:complete len:201 (-) Transcript_106574:2073-2675(-)
MPRRGSASRRRPPWSERADARHTCSGACRCRSSPRALVGAAGPWGRSTRSTTRTPRPAAGRPRPWTSLRTSGRPSGGRTTEATSAPRQTWTAGCPSPRIRPAGTSAPASRARRTTNRRRGARRLRSDCQGLDQVRASSGPRRRARRLTPAWWRCWKHFPPDLRVALMGCRKQRSITCRRRSTGLKSRANPTSTRPISRVC